ncbi:hypothetical protein KGQ34_01855 [Patescibacteria group bacterium]|nr:hypothetical protein [Patescibacteria group bacterium]
MENAMIFRLFFAVLLMLCDAGFARAEYILRLPNVPDIRFESAETENILTPFGVGNRPGEQEWIQKLQPRFPDANKDYSKEDWDAGLSRVWSRIRPREQASIELDLPHFNPFNPNFLDRDHIMIFYTIRTGVLIAQGKEIMFPYSQIMIDKNHLRFLEPYRTCFRDITPQEWPLDEPRLYASIRVKIRGTVDRIETDEPFVWKGITDSVRFMDVYLRDIEVLKIDCK